MPSFSRKASGDILPYRFVKLDTSILGNVLQCGAGEEIYGVSQPGTRNVPWSPLDDGFAAIAGENVNIFGPPEKDVMLVLNDTVTIGARLKSDTDGGALPTTSANDEVGAIALRDGDAGDLIPVQLITERY